MNVIDELVPLTEKDVELLKSRQFTATWGCAVVCFVVIGVLCLTAYQFFWESYLALVQASVV